MQHDTLIFLIGDTRSGSTTFSDALASSLGVFSLGEIFYNVDEKMDVDSQRAAAILEFEKIQPFKGFVAKIMYHDILIGQGVRYKLGGTPFILSQIKNKFYNPTIIHLTRKEYLEAAYSEFKAVATGVFHSPAGSVDNAGDDEFEISEEAWQEILVDAQERETSFRIVKEFLRLIDIQKIEIDYSHLVDGTAQGILQSHLGPIKKLDFPFRKIVVGRKDARRMMGLSGRDASA